MSTYNGEKYLEQQIENIFAQVGDIEIRLLIRDDGSTDNSVDIIRACQKKYGKLEYAQGKNLGSNKSFWTLIKNAPDCYDYYAISDQDDVWDVDKLSSAIGMIKKRLKNGKTGVLYFSNLKVVDENLNFCRNSHSVSRNQRSKYSALVEAMLWYLIISCYVFYKRVIQNNFHAMTREYT